MRSRHVPLVKEEPEALHEELDLFLDHIEEAGAVLQTLRKKNGWSLGDLAREAGVAKSHLAAFESGEQQIPERLAKRFSEIFDAPAHLFL